MRNCRYGISKKLWISDKRLCSNLRRIEFSDPDYQYYIGRLLIFSSIVVNPYFTFLSCFQLFDTHLRTTSAWFLLMNGLIRKEDLSNKASCLFRCPEQRDRCFIKWDNIPRFFKIVTDNHYYGYRYYRTIFAGSLTSET